ncbi:MAG: indolepyruvate ferredoxin oxidoreductase subunit alpha [Clostridiaceae bacterium]|nr:indolepyruvate ferredoxin oxidoreductase subunit alpha [Clostridiaceae bacterium]
MKQILLGNEAIARGAYEAGVKVVSSYPGTPSTEITEAVAGYDRIFCEWSTNEKVGAEVAIGASIRGARAMTCMKHVGLNVAADPLFTSSYTGVNGGLVYVVADDPGMHSSQNEQDSRHYARAAKIPMLEPSDAQECKDFVVKAFELSEKYDTPVLIRLQTRVSHSRSIVEFGEPNEIEVKDYSKDVSKYVMMPAMAVKRHKIVEKRMEEIMADSSEQTEAVGMHEEHIGSSELGIITSGAAYQYVKEALPEASVLKLGMIWPLPEKRIRSFAKKVKRLVIVEELDPFFEKEILAMGIPCEGKSLLPITGEYSTSVLRKTLNPTSTPEQAISGSGLPVAPGRPPVMCAGCPHKGLFMALSRLKVQVMGDIGCYTLGALPPTSAMDTCVCMGASVGMAHGFDKASDARDSRKTVAVIGDSTFLHSGVTNLINAVYNQSSVTVIILDNSITGMTGHQQNASTGMDIRLSPAPAISLELLCESIGVRSIQVVDPVDTDLCRKKVKEELEKPGVSVIIARRPCALIPTGKGPKGKYARVDKDICTACGQCIRIMCPALTAGPDNKPVIDRETCNCCGLCVNVCPVGALSVGGDL